MYLGLITVILATAHSLPTKPHYLERSEFVDGASLNRAPRRLDAGFHNRNEATIEKVAAEYHDNKIFKRSDGDFIIYAHAHATNPRIPEQNIDLANIKRSISSEPSGDNSHVDFKTRPEGCKKINSPRGCVTASDNAFTTTENIADATQMTTQENEPVDSSYINSDTSYESPIKYDTQEVKVKVSAADSDSSGQTSENEIKGPVLNNARNATGGAESAQGFGKPGANVDEDRWIWGVTEEAVTTPEINNRVAFDGGTCPTGKIKVAGKCVDVD